MKKEDFDIYKYMKSATKKDPTIATLSGKYAEEDLLDTNIDRLDEAKLKREQEARSDPFGTLGVGSADKMTFFLLKWVFNAIKHDSAEDDPKLKGQSFVSKTDLVKQLGKNPELMRSLSYDDQR
jgi:hypothetical protein